ncbi:MAG: restriction endonuclease subunit S [Desulfovibrionaceae bacterium]|nr:restriction endonuclease subunit S [Desulfovibrionaceae bacterium]
MNRIDDLIAKLCPKGVEFKELGECAEYSNTRIDASKLDETNFVGVDNLLQNAAGKADAKYPPNTARLTAYEVGDILLGNIRPYLKKIWLADDGGGCSGDVLAIRITEAYRPKLMPEFLYRLMASDVFFAYNMQHAKGAKMPRGSKEAILKYRIPVPPLDVQREIVKVLDAFTQLEAELEAELEARRRQYQYYRDALLSFAGKDDIRWATLGEVAKSYRGTAITEAKTTDGIIPVVANSPLPVYFHGESNRSGETIVVARSGAYAGLITFWDQPIFLTDAFSIHPDVELLNTKFVYYFLQNKQSIIHSIKKGSGVPHVRVKDFESFRIPIPPLSEQARIVAILDTFDALVNDLTSGLPAEIAARRTQYAHYRDRLLTFKEAA